MGNQSSKPAGSHVPTSPVANHSSSSSTSNSLRKDPKPQPSHRSHNVNTSAPNRSAHRDNQSHSANSSPSQRHRPDDTMGNDQSRQQALDSRKKEKEKEKEKTKHGKATPMKVPRGSDPRRQRGPDSQFEPSGPPRDPNYVPHSNLNFPPRLPLPIEEEVHAPGSPVLAPQGLSSSLDGSDIDGHIPRPSSVVSSTTIEDDAAGDELQPYPYEQPPRGAVPTLLQWKKGGERVYVTGTFAGWSRKFRMHRE